MNFVKSSPNANAGPNFQWRDNPTYQTPESRGVSWYDQVNHWDPHSEGIFSISQASTDRPIPYWASHESNIQSIRNTWGASTSTNSLTQNPITKTSAQSVAPAVSGLPTEVEGALAASSSLANGAATAVKVAQGTEAAAAATPWGAIALLNSMLGDATSAGIDASNRQTITKDFQANSMKPGSQSQFQAGLIREQQTIHANNELAGSRIGGVFGPLGAWFGSLLANAIQDNAPKDIYNTMKTGYSFDGKFNPQDTAAVNSGTTAELSGQTNMQDNLTAI